MKKSPHPFGSLISIVIDVAIDRILKYLTETAEPTTKTDTEKGK
ncbi:MAG TPA: hypothetical protein PKO06_01090 [Candidatus Ozemobacteraceae bacterium]|nr:hypothetical protein [Candidatus Ozemobacteraceae bacterium]